MNSPKLELFHHGSEGVCHSLLFFIQSLVKVHIEFLLCPLNTELGVRYDLIVVGDPWDLSFAGIGKLTGKLEKR